MIFIIKGDWKIFIYFILFVTSYILGSIPFGLILSKFFGYGDIRKIGSGNIGATNALRTGNKFLASSVLFFDFIKGFIPIFLVTLYLENISSNFLIYLGIACILGHCYPVWLSFNGGKGVATSIGVFISINFFVGLLFILVWSITFFLTKKSSFSSLISFLSMPLPILLILGNQVFFGCILILVIIFIRHKDNINRLINNNEKNIKF